MQRDSLLISFVRMAFVFIRVQRFVHWETSKATVTSDTGQEWSFVETDSRRNNRSVKLCLNFAAPRNSRATASQPRKRWRWGGGWWDKNGSFFLHFFFFFLVRQKWPMRIMQREQHSKRNGHGTNEVGLKLDTWKSRQREARLNATSDGWSKIGDHDDDSRSNTTYDGWSKTYWTACDNCATVQRKTFN